MIEYIFCISCQRPSYILIFLRKQVVYFRKISPIALRLEMILQLGQLDCNNLFWGINSDTQKIRFCFSITEEFCK